MRSEEQLTADEAGLLTYWLHRAPRHVACRYAAQVRDARLESHDAAVRLIWASVVGGAVLFVLYVVT